MTVLLHDLPPRLELPSASGLLDRLVSVLADADLRGRGGGAFPTATKLRSAAGRRPVLVVNACDGEPLVAKDVTLLHRSPGLVADGVALIARAVGARSVVLAAHEGSVAERLAGDLVRTERALLPRPSVLPVPPRYVSSEASALAALLSGGPAKPTHRERPLTDGDPRGRSVLVLNAETVAQVALVWARARGGGPADRPLTRLVTVTGAVSRPGVVEVDDTATLGGLVAAAGGHAGPATAVLVGGYGGTWRVWDEVATSSLAELARSGTALGAGLLHLLGAECPVEAVGRIATFLAEESTGQCGPCMFGLPAVAADWWQLADPRAAGPAQERLERRLGLVAGRGACHHPDGVVRQLATALVTFGPHLAEHRTGRCARQPIAAGAR